MNKTRLAVGGAFVAVLAIGIIYALVSQRPVALMQPPTTTNATYSLEEVSTHKTTASCWTVIDGSVYDLTTWINRHPGGPQAIVGLCGIDGSAAYKQQHGTARKPLAALILLKIGTQK
jgi:cytochrome b involved in lipid metabolism